MLNKTQTVAGNTTFTENLKMGYFIIYMPRGTLYQYGNDKKLTMEILTRQIEVLILIRKLTILPAYDIDIAGIVLLHRYYTAKSRFIV